MDYTIFQNQHGTWAVNYVDLDGVRQRISLKTKKKSEALQMAKLHIEDYLNSSKQVYEFAEYANIFYQPGCPWTERKAKFNRPLKPQTLKRYRWYLDNVIIPYFAGMSLVAITDKHVSDFALSLKYDGTTKNDIVSLVKHIIDEAVLDGIRTHGVNVMRFPKSRSTYQAINTDTIKKLWPDDFSQLYDVWNTPRMKDKTGPWTYATLTGLILSAGLRSGEARGLGIQHLELFNDYGFVYVERALDRENDLSGVKGDKGEGRARVVIIPEKTVKLLQHYLSLQQPKEFLFIEAGTPIDKNRLNKRLHVVCQANGVENITPHALRFTYKSRTRALVDEMTGRLMMGHRSEEMSDWYDRPVLQERARQFKLLGIDEKLQGVWG